MFDQVYLTRQSDIINSKLLGRKITVIGAGAIGSHTVMMLSRMGLNNIEVWDFDDVSAENMNNQGYDIEDIGYPKVDCLAKKINKAMGLTIESKHERYEGQQLTGIVISAVDSMKVRKMIYDCNVSAQYIIDPRMAAEHASLFAYPAGSDIYVKSLFPDSDVAFTPCTAKSTIYTASLISGLVVKVVKDIIVGKPYTKHVEWDIANNKFESWSSNAR